MFLIQGVFFQQQQYLGLDCLPTEGVVATINRGLFRTMFAGVIYFEKQELRGCMLDVYGESVLKDIVITDENVSFMKHYDGRKDVIGYSFKMKHGNTWVGQYSGTAVGVGLSRCVITEVGDEFMLPNLPVQLMGKSAHKWPDSYPG